MAVYNWIGSRQFRQKSQSGPEDKVLVSYLAHTAHRRRGIRSSEGGRGPGSCRWGRTGRCPRQRTGIPSYDSVPYRGCGQVIVPDLLVPPLDNSV